MLVNMYFFHVAGDHLSALHILTCHPLVSGQANISENVRPEKQVFARAKPPE